MNIKNLKVVTVTGSMTDVSNTTFTVPVNLTFVPQYMKIKKVTWTLQKVISTANFYNTQSTNQIFNITSSLTNYETLISFSANTISTFTISVGDPPTVTHFKQLQAYNEHLDIIFKLYNQIINGNYSFTITAPIIGYDSYEMNVAIQLEFIEYA